MELDTTLDGISILNDKFRITIRHKECKAIVGLVRGGLTGVPRMNCFSCDEMLNSDEVDIKFEEIK